MQRIRSLRRVRGSCWPIWAPRGQAKWWLRLPPARGLSRRSTRSSPRASNEGPIKNGGRRVIFVSGDHSESNDFVMSLIESFGFAPIYLGGLATGGRLQQAGGP